MVQHSQVFGLQFKHGELLVKHLKESKVSKTSLMVQSKSNVRTFFSATIN
jgi:hypothetical protein